MSPPPVGPPSGQRLQYRKLQRLLGCDLAVKATQSTATAADEFVGEVLRRRRRGGIRVHRPILTSRPAAHQVLDRSRSGSVRFLSHS